MKRILTVAAAIAASAAFAAPANAAVADTSSAVATPCKAGEALTTCAERVARTAPDQAITLAFATINGAGRTLGSVIVTVDRTVDNAMAAAENACEVVFPTCVSLL